MQTATVNIPASPFALVVFRVVGVLVLAAAAVIILPFLLLGAILGGAALLVLRCWIWLRQARGPNGAFDGRRNVRVRIGDGGESGD